MVRQFGRDVVENIMKPTSNRLIVFQIFYFSFVYELIYFFYLFLLYDYYFSFLRLMSLIGMKLLCICLY